MRFFTLQVEFIKLSFSRLYLIVEKNINKIVKYLFDNEMKSTFRGIRKDAETLTNNGFIRSQVHYTYG